MKAFLVCFQNDSKETVYLLLKKLPMSWNNGIPTYNMCSLIDSVIVGDTEDEKDFKWHIAGHPDYTPLQYFYYSHIEPGECSLIELDEDDKLIRLKTCVGKWMTDIIYQEDRETVYIIYGRDPIYCSDRFIMLKSLPIRWEGDNPIYNEDQFICHIDCDQRFEIAEPDDLFPYNPYTWCANKMVVGGAAVFERHGRKLELHCNFKSTLHMTCISDSECVDGECEKVDVPSDTCFLVRFEDYTCGKDNLFLLKRMPMSWCDQIPVYRMEDFICAIDSDSEYVVECPYGVIGCAYDWGTSTLGAGYVAGFRLKDKTLVFEEIYSRRFVTEDTVTHIGGKVAYLSNGSDRTDHSDCVFAGDIPPCDFWAPADEPEDQPDKAIDEVNKSVDQLLSDNVNHPSHYTSHPSGIECIEITKHHDFCIGNAIKYLWRQGLKQDADKSAKDKQIEDLKKAIWYINKKIEMLEDK